MFISPTDGEMSIKDAAQKIKRVVEANPENHYELFVGSDSQNSFYTKMVTVVALHIVGKGGFYFYEISRYDKIKDLRRKLWTETQLSLDAIEKFFNAFDEIGFDYSADNLSVCIHVDAGECGPSGALIPELMGYIKSCGYQAEAKPDSPIASCIADRISK